MDRARIDTPLQTGVRVLDTLTTVGKGQRMGLFAGSGVGKSSLLSMIARGTDAEVSVIALVGERGREVREFLEDDLGAEGLARSVVVVATSDEPALMRLRAAFVATRIAESFRDQGQDVMLMMDSLTRVAMAQREIGLSAGEPPATRGYPPSTFSLLARLLERAGTAETGSVTGIYTVLVDGDDHNEPIADAARSILDGHVVLDRKLAVTGHFPSVDVLGSVSRVATKVNSRPAPRRRGHPPPGARGPQGGAGPDRRRRLSDRDQPAGGRRAEPRTRGQRVPSAADGRIHRPPRVLAAARPPYFDPGSSSMNREFSLAGLLRLRQLQQDQAATGLARARSRSSSVRVREAAARRELAATDDPVSSSASLRAVAAARSSSHSMLADLQNLTRLAEADEATARAEFIAARTRSVGLEKLQARHDAEINSADLRAEQSVLDEIASTLWHREDQQVKP